MYGAGITGVPMIVHPSFQDVGVYDSKFDLASETREGYTAIVVPSLRLTPQKVGTLAG